MNLYIVRHGSAAPHGSPGVPDEERPLTEEGIQKMKQIAQGLRALEMIPDVILSSPLVRARQTAEILLRAFEADEKKLRLIQALAPSGSRPQLHQEIHAYRKLQSVMLVGHQPSLGEIAGEIAWGSADHCLELKKGGVCALAIEELLPTPRGTLFCLLTPAILRAFSPR